MSFIFKVKRQNRRGKPLDDRIPYIARSDSFSQYPGGVVLIPFTVLTGNVIPLYRTSIWIVRTAYSLAGIQVVSEGQDNVPANTACIFMCNHLSNLDPPALLPQIPGRTAAFFKRSLMKIPALGYAMRLAGFVPVSRDGSVQGAQESCRRTQSTGAGHSHHNVR